MLFGQPLRPNRKGGWEEDEDIQSDTEHAAGQVDPEEEMKKMD